MAAPFARTLRSIEADRGWGSRLVWIVAVLLAGAWIVWFTTAEVTVGAQRLTPAQMLFRRVTGQ